MIPRHRIANLIGIEDFEALAALCRAQHPQKGLVVGHCVCGTSGFQPTPPACRALRELVELADLAEVQTQ